MGCSPSSNNGSTANKADHLTDNRGGSGEGVGGLGSGEKNPSSGDHQQNYIPQLFTSSTQAGGGIKGKGGGLFSNHLSSHLTSTKMTHHIGLAFPKEDALYNGIYSGADRLGWSVTPVRSEIVAGGNWNDSDYDPTMFELLFLDYRQPKLLPQNTLSIIRRLKDENSILVVIAFVKKTFYEKSDPLNVLLEAGVDQIEVDTGITSTNYWQIQLSQYQRCLLTAAVKLETAKALAAALDHCRDLVIVTDTSHRIQFVNRAYEKIVGYSLDEVAGCDFHEFQNKASSGITAAHGGDQDGSQSQPPTTGLYTSSHLPCISASGKPPGDSGGISSPTAISPPTNLAVSSSATASIGIPMHDHILADLSQGKEWEGSYVYNPKIGEPIYLTSRILPYNCHLTRGTRLHDISNSPASEVGGHRGRTPTHYIYISDLPSSYVEKSFSSDVTSSQDAAYPMPRGSLKSLRKASYDIKSISNDSNTDTLSESDSSCQSLPADEYMRSILRRQSLAKLHSLTIEAPITKVINIIAAAQQNCPLYIAQALEKVLEILRTTELYSPQFFEGNKPKSDDPLTTDLLGALLSGPRIASTTGRRSSNENTASRLAPRPSLPDIAEAPSNLQKLLETEEQWGFDVILLEEITEKRPLVWLGMTTFMRFGVAQILNTDEKTLRNWLTLIEANYHSSNSYHNSTHAADVLQSTAYFLSTERLKTFLEPMDEVISLIAAAVHDVDHPGKSSAFMMNSGNDLALLYNDLSVLESHHAAFTFKLTLSDPRVNIFKNLDGQTYKTVRQSVIDMVLATEMTKHFEHLSKFVNVFTKPLLKESTVSGMGMCGADGGTMDVTPVTPTEPDISTLITSDNVILVKRMLIKCADVSNPTRPLKLCAEWANRIAEEYFRQTEEEIARGLPVVMPMFDRKSCSIPKSQTGFIDYFVADMYEAWDAFIDVPEVIEYMKYNYDYWKDVEGQGLRTGVFNDAYLLQNPPPNPSTGTRVSHL